MNICIDQNVTHSVESGAPIMAEIRIIILAIHSVSNEKVFRPSSTLGSVSLEGVLGSFSSSNRNYLVNYELSGSEYQSLRRVTLLVRKGG